MFIRSERLFLRPGWPEDWQELHQRIDDEQVVRNLARAPWPYFADDARSFLGMSQHPRMPHFLVTLPTSLAPAEIVGCVGLAADGEAVELGYWFARDHWGKGFATEAARAVISLARTLGHRQLVAGHFADNPASGRVLHKLGFRPTGTMRKRFSLARGGEVDTIEHQLDLAGPCDCDGPERMLRAA